MGEGGADFEFFRALIEERNLPDLQAIKPAGGDTFYGRRLQAMKFNRGLDQVKTLVLATDSNGDPNAAFAKVAAQVRDAQDYGVPAAPLAVSVSPTAGLPGIAILSLPWINVLGSLETLLLGPLSAKWPGAAARAEDFIVRSATNASGVSGRSKALVACLVAAVCTDDPSSAVSSLWYERKGFRGILGKGDPALDQLVTYLSAL